MEVRRQDWDKTEPVHGINFVWRITRCAWCGKLLGKDMDADGTYADDYESHGICTLCEKKHFGTI